MESGVFLTGNPEPRRVFSYPSHEDLEWLVDIQVCSTFALSITSRGHINVHQVPGFGVTAFKRLPAVVSVGIQDEEHVVVLHSTRPIVYDLTCGVAISMLVRPRIPGGERISYTSMSNKDNLIVASTSSGALCLWDTRSAEPPQVLTFRSSFGIQSVSANGQIIAAGYSNAQISVFDPRNFRVRLADFDLAPSLGTQTGDRVEYTIVPSDLEPWFLGFQLASGPAGILDLMQGEVRTILEPPEFSAAQTAQKPRPLFWQGMICVAYPWSHTLQVYNYGHRDNGQNSLNEIELEGAPIAMDGCDDIDGIYVAFNDGVVAHVF
jgi:hypothetical protein